MFQCSDGKDDKFVLSDSALDVGGLTEWVIRDGCGANVTFTGTTRDHSHSATGVKYLEFDAYEETVFDYFAQIATEIRQKWSTVGATAMGHRVGRVEVGENCVVVAVSAPHRTEAFEAGEYGIQRLKEIVPIWKKEVSESGSHWVDHC